MSDKIQFFHILPSPSPQSEGAIPSISSLKGRMVKVQSDSNIDDEKILKKIQEVGEQLLSEQEIQLPTITISTKGDELIALKGAVELTKGTPSLVRRMDTSFKGGVSWIHRCKKDIENLHPKGKGWLSFVVTCEVILFPLSFIAYALFSLVHAIASYGAKTARQKAAVQELSLLLTTGGYENFLQTMSSAVKVMKRCKVDNAIVGPLQNAIHYGELLHKALSNAESMEDLIRPIEDDITNGGKGRIFIPCGSFMQDTFIPAFLAIEKTKEEPTKYIISKISLSPASSGEKQKTTQRYELDSKVFSYEMKRVISCLQPSSQITDKEREKLSYVQERITNEDRALQKRPIRSALDMVCESWEEIDLEEGQNKERVAGSSSDPLSLLYHMTEEISSKSPLKEDFFHLFVSELTRQYVKYSYTLKDKQKEVLLSGLMPRIDKLGRRLKKSYGHEIATEYIETIKTSLAKQSSTCRRKEAKGLCEHQRTLLERPPRSPSKPSLLIDRGSKPSAEEGSTLSKSRPTPTESRSIDPQVWTLCTTLEQDMAEAALPSLHSLTEKARGLLREGNLEEARVVVENTLLNLPQASSPVVSSISDQGLIKLTQLLIELKEILLEIRLRSGAPCLSTKQLIALASTSLLVSSSIQKKVDAALLLFFTADPMTHEEIDDLFSQSPSLTQKWKRANEKSEETLRQLCEDSLQFLLGDSDKFDAWATRKKIDPHTQLLFSLTKKPSLDISIQEVILSNPLLQINKDPHSDLFPHMQTLSMMSDKRKSPSAPSSFFDFPSSEQAKMLTLLQKDEVLLRALIAPEHYLQAQRSLAPEEPLQSRGDYLHAIDKKGGELFAKIPLPRLDEALKVRIDKDGTAEIVFGDTHLSYLAAGSTDLPLNFYPTRSLIGTDNYPLLRLVEGHPDASAAPCSMQENSAHTAALYLYQAKTSPITDLEPAVEAQLLALDTRHYTAANAAIDLIIENTESLNDPLLQARVLQVLSKHRYLLDSMIITSGAWKGYLADLEKTYNEMVLKKDVESIIFLSYVIRLIAATLPIAKKEIKSYESKIVKTSFFSESDSFLTSLQQYRETKEEDNSSIAKILTDLDSLSVGSYPLCDHQDLLLRYFTHQTDLSYAIPSAEKTLLLLSEGDVSLLSEDLCTRLLYWWTLSCQGAFSQKGWDSHFITKEHMMRRLLPQFIKKIEKSPHILSALFQTLNPSVQPPSSPWRWTRMKGSFHYRENDAGLFIDLQEGVAKDLYEPKQARSTPSFDTLMQDPLLSSILQGGAVLEQDDGEDSRIIKVQKGAKIFEITLKEDGAFKDIVMMLHGKKYHHTTGKLEDRAQALAHHIQKQGLWHETGSDTYLLVLEDNQHKDVEIVEIQLDKNKKIISAKNGSGKHLCLSSHLALKEAFNLVSSFNKLFFSSTPKGPIDEVVLIEAGVILQKKGEASWHLKDDPTASFDNAHLIELMVSLGKEIGQVLLPLSRGKDREYHIFARPLRFLSYKAERQKVEIEENGPLRQLILHINAQGRMQGDHSIFLYLAQYCLYRGDIAQSSFYLDKVLSDEAIAPEDTTSKQHQLQHIMQIEKELMSMEPRSDAEVALLLKAQLSISAIKTQSYYFTEKLKKSEEQILEEQTKLYHLYRRYSNALKDPKKTRAFKDLHLLLSNKHMQQAALWSERAQILLQGIVKNPSTPLLEKPQKLSLLLLSYLATLAEQPKKAMPLPKKGYLTKELITNFFSYARWIEGQNIDPAALTILEEGIDPAADPQLSQAIDEARRLLLLMSHSRTFPEVIPEIFPSKNETWEKQPQKLQTFIDTLSSSLQRFIEKGIQKYKKPYLGTSHAHEALTLSDDIASLQKKMSLTNFLYIEKGIEQLEESALVIVQPRFSPITNTLSTDTTTEGKLTEGCTSTLDRDKELEENEKNKQAALKEFTLEGQEISPPLSKELLRIKQGIEAAFNERAASINSSMHEIIDPSKLDRLADKLTSEKESTFKERSKILTAIETLAFKHSDALDIQILEKRGGLSTFGDLLIILLAHYENGQIKGRIPHDDALKLENKLTAFLSLSTKIHLLEKALTDPTGSLAQLRSLKEMGTPERAPEWKAACFEMNKKIGRGCDLTFFFNKDGTVEDQALVRPAMVFGYRNQIGVTKEQLEVLKRVIDDPHALEELRMGLGKSFVIAPLVAKILANKGNNPVILFTEELINLSKKDMDPRAYEFFFRRNPPLDSLELAEQYKTLLEVKARGGYILSTTSRLAALENKYHELMGQLSKKSLHVEEAKKAYESKPDAEEEEKRKAQALYTQSLTELKELYSQIKWIKKIYLFFDPTRMNTRFIIDEVDAILHISSEINYAEGLSQKVSPLAQEVGYLIFENILKTQQDPHLEKLKGALQENTQASLDESTVKQAMQTLALQLCRDPQVQQKLGITHQDSERMGLYLCHAERRHPLQQHWDDDSTQKAFTAMLRHWLCRTFPLICKKTYGINFGIGEDGATVVPMEGGRAKLATMFGQECEIIGYHLLGYLQQGCTDEHFFLRTLRQIQARPIEDRWRGEMLQDIGYDEKRSLDEQKKDLFTRFHEPRCYSLRVKFAFFFLYHTSKVQIYKRQIPLLVQDIILEKEAAGISGSMNSYALCDSFTKKKIEPRSVAGDLIMRLQGQDGGLEALVETFKDPLEKMAELSKDTGYKAIINIAASLPGMSTKEVIEALRKKAPKRQYIFIDSQSKLPYLWQAGESEPQPFHKKRDALLIKGDKALFYFSPADTRGTDFVIPSGKGAIIPGATTTLSELEQGIWRLRKLGMGHTATFFIEESLAAKIKSSSQKQTISCSALILEILTQTIEEDKRANFKREAVNPSSILKKHIKLAQLRSDTSIQTDQDDLFLKKAQEERLAYQAISTLFRKEQKMDLKGDFLPCEDMPTIDVLKNLYDQEIDRARTLEAACRSAHTNPTYLLQAIEDTKQELLEKKEELSKRAEEILSALDPQVASNTSCDTDAQCQIEVEQQQTLTLEPPSKVLRSLRSSQLDADLPIGHELDNIGKFLLNLKMLSMFPQEAPSYVSYLSSFFPMVDDEAFFVSKIVASQLASEGASGRIHVYAATDKQGSFILIAPSELHSVVLGAIDPSDEVRIYSLRLGQAEPLAIVDDHPEITKEDRIFQRRLCQAKLALGASSFSLKEQGILKEWFIGFNEAERTKIITFLKEKGGSDVANLLTTWLSEEVQEQIESRRPAAHPKAVQEEKTISLPPLDTSAKSAQHEERAATESASIKRLSDNIKAMNWATKKLAETILGISLDRAMANVQQAHFTESEFSHIREWLKQTIPADASISEQISLGKSLMKTHGAYLKEEGGCRKFYEREIAPAFAAAKKKSKPQTLNIEDGIVERKPSVYVPHNFIIDKGGMGNCASLALLDQINQRGIRGYSSQKELRQAVGKALINLTAVDPQLDGIISSSLKDAAVEVSSQEENRKKYAAIISTDGQWLDAPFFYVASKMLQRQIVIIRKDPSGMLSVQERFPVQTIDSSKSLFLFFSKTAGGAADHYQSIDLAQREFLDSLIDKDRKEPIKSLLQLANDDTKTVDEKLPSIRRAMEDLKQSDSQAYQNIMKKIDGTISTQSLPTLGSLSLEEILIDQTQDPATAASIPEVWKEEPAEEPKETQGILGSVKAYLSKFFGRS